MTLPRSPIASASRTTRYGVEIFSAKAKGHLIGFSPKRTKTYLIEVAKNYFEDLSEEELSQLLTHEEVTSMLTYVPWYTRHKGLYLCPTVYLKFGKTEAEYTITTKVK